MQQTALVADRGAYEVTAHAHEACAYGAARMAAARAGKADSRRVKVSRRLAERTSVTPRAAAAAAATTTVFAWTRLVDLDRAAADFLAVEGADGVVGAVLHLDEAEA